jgi:hypothetical protein
MSNLIIVDNPSEIDGDERTNDAAGDLTSWIVGTVGPWRDYRNNLPETKRWAEYYRMWRGYWDTSSKSRGSERSRLIAPALAQAIETSVAEAEEALLSREAWFDVADDVIDEDKNDTALLVAMLREDLEAVHAKAALSEAFTNGALFGTGLLKENVDIVESDEVVRNEEDGSLEPYGEKRVIVRLEAVKPTNFIPDPAGCTIAEMQGFAIDYPNKPCHEVLEKIEKGIYRREALPFVQAMQRPRREDDADLDPTVSDRDTKTLNLCEYHGKVPLFMLEKAMDGSGGEVLDDLLAQDFQADGDEGPLVEAIITIANGSILLRAMVNPFINGERSVKAFRWDVVPSKFWGRGVAEKGYNPQKALDAELRARIDTLGFVSAPMLGMDAGRVPRGFKPEVKPGKIWLTNGNPSEVLQPVGIGQVNPNTFNHTGELQNMVAQGTGAMDTPTQLRNSSASGGSAATGGSMMLGAFVKRTKRAVMNIERELIVPMIRSVARRYMQFSPTRYPFNDVKFAVKGGLGIIAREIEQLNLTQLIAMLPEGSNTAKLAAAKGFIELSSVINKHEIFAALAQDNETLASQQQAQQEQQAKIAELEQQVKQLEMEALTLQNQKTIAETRELLSRAEVNERKADDSDVRTSIEIGKLELQQGDLINTMEQNELNERRVDLQERQLELKEKEMNNRSV